MSWRSMTAPIVATKFTGDLETPDPAQAQRTLVKWKAFAKDLGKKGRDEIYGDGEILVEPDDERDAIAVGGY